MPNSVDGPETARRYFLIGVFDFRFFDQPEFARNPTGLSDDERLEALEYLKANVPEFALEEVNPSFQFGGVCGHGGIDYHTVTVSGGDHEGLYLFRLRAMLPEDEQELAGQAKYKWRICGFAKSWPTYHHQATWTNT